MSLRLSEWFLAENTINAKKSDSFSVVKMKNKRTFCVESEIYLFMYKHHTLPRYLSIAYA